MTQTPTLQAVAQEDELQLLEDLQQRVDAAVAQVDVQENVMAAHAEYGKTEQQLQKLRKAERELHVYARRLAEKIAVVRESALDALIQSAGEGVRPETKPLSELAAYESRARHLSQAIERLVEERIPLAQIHARREESHAILTKVKAFEALAQERAEKLLGQLREAVTEEVVLPVDLSKGVSGALLHQAAEYKQRAVQLAASADELERAYMSRQRPGLR